MEMFLLYVWTMLDRFNAIIGTTLLFSVPAAGIGFLAMSDMHLEAEKKACLKFIKVCACVFTVSLLCYIFVPSKKDALVLGAGYAIVSIAKSDKATSLSSKAMEYIEQELTSAIKPAKKEAQ